MGHKPTCQNRKSKYKQHPNKCTAAKDRRVQKSSRGKFQSAQALNEYSKANPGKPKPKHVDHSIARNGRQGAWPQNPLPECKGREDKTVYTYKGQGI